VGCTRHQRRAQSGPLAVIPFTMSNSAVLFVPAALAASGFVRLFAGAFAFASAGAPTGLWRQRPSRRQQFRTPMRGDGAPTGRTRSFGRACDARPPVPGRPGPLSALHRGGFRMRTHEAGSRQWDTGARSDCPRQALTPGGRGPDLPPLRFAPQRGTPLLAPSFRIVSRKRPS
jgi:hypothetical protein